jgi:uncharacterized membrane protein YkoI
MRRHHLALLLILPALAHGPASAEAAVALHLAGDIGPAKAAAAARAATGGKVLSVHAARDDGRAVYRVKLLLPGGRVRTVTVDADSGHTG